MDEGRTVCQDESTYEYLNIVETVNRNICAAGTGERCAEYFMTLLSSSFSFQELRKPSYAEICQRVKDAPTLQQPPTPKEAKPACAAPAGEERKCPDASIPAGEAKARETYPSSSSSSSKPGSATPGRPPRDGRRPAGRWASPPPPHPGKNPSKDPHHTPPKSPQ